MTKIPNNLKGYTRQFTKTGGTHYLAIPKSLLALALMPENSFVHYFSPTEGVILVEQLPTDILPAGRPPHFDLFLQTRAQILENLHAASHAILLDSPTVCDFCKKPHLGYLYQNLKICHKCDQGLSSYLAYAHPVKV